jgi:hypothetical protein
MTYLTTPGPEYGKDNDGAIVMVLPIKR